MIAAGVRPFARYSGRYDHWYDRNTGVWRAELAAVARALRGAPRPWVEVGAGTGRFAAPLGFDLALEPAAAAAARARRRGLVVVRGIAEALPAPTGGWGTVLLATTLCFLADPDRSLAELRRVLCPGGVLIVAALRADGRWGARLRHRARIDPFYRPAHLWPARELRWRLRRAGFRWERGWSLLAAPPRPGMRVPRVWPDWRGGFLVGRWRRPVGAWPAPYAERRSTGGGRDGSLS